MDAGFRDQVRARRPLIGTFIKTGAAEIAELVGHAGFDFAVADAEHAPLGLERVEQLVLGARSVSLPLLVRVAGSPPGEAGRMLDLGAAGVVFPHIDGPGSAAAAVAACRYAGGKRGYSPSTRAGGYGVGDAGGYAERADAAVGVWCQIEDRAALDRIDDIAAIEAIDCLFIGRADLAQSLGVAGADDSAVEAAVVAIAAAGARHGRAIGLFVGAAEPVARFVAVGISVFVCGSDQSHLLAAGSAAVQRLRRESAA